TSRCWTPTRSKRWHATSPGQAPSRRPARSARHYDVYFRVRGRTSLLELWAKPATWPTCAFGDDLTGQVDARRADPHARPGGRLPRQAARQSRRRWTSAGGRTSTVARPSCRVGAAVGEGRLGQPAAA